MEDKLYTFRNKLIDYIWNNLLWRNKMKAFVQSMHLEGNEHVLDFGCGSGSLSRHLAALLAKKGGRITCVDISPAWVKIAKRRMAAFKNVEFHIGHLSDLPLPDSSFDLVLVAAVLHEVKKSIQGEITTTLARKLKPNGRLIISEPTEDGHGIPATTIKALLCNAGLTEIECIRNDERYHAIYTK